MHTLWVAHITKVLDDLPQDERQGLLALLQKAEADWSRPAAPAERSGGVFWDKRKERWIADGFHKGTRRRYGRFAERSEAEAQAEAVRAYVKAKGQLPPAGWLGVRSGLTRGKGRSA